MRHLRYRLFNNVRTLRFYNAQPLEIRLQLIFKLYRGPPVDGHRFRRRLFFIIPCTDPEKLEEYSSWALKTHYRVSNTRLVRIVRLKHLLCSNYPLLWKKIARTIRFSPFCMYSQYTVRAIKSLFTWNSVYVSGE